MHGQKEVWLQEASIFLQIRLLYFSRIFGEERQTPAFHLALVIT